MKYPHGNNISDSDRELLRQLYERNGPVCLAIIVTGFLDRENDLDSRWAGVLFDHLTTRLSCGMELRDVVRTVRTNGGA